MIANDSDYATIGLMHSASSASTNTDYRLQWATRKQMVTIGNICMILSQKQMETAMKNWPYWKIHQQFTISATRDGYQHL